MFDLGRTAAMAWADFLERSRRPAFLVTLGVGLWAAWFFSPPQGASYSTIDLGGHRGAYGSAWIGSATAMLIATFFSLAGFFIVKNAIAGDRSTGVGSILAATPMRNAEYTVAKWISNTLLLGAMMCVVMVGTGAMQLLRAEDPHLQPLALVAPFVLMTLPALAITAAIAVLFEAIPGLRSGGGNIFYFFFWAFGLIMPGVGFGEGGGTSWDPLGIHVLMNEMIRDCAAAFPDFAAHRDHISIGINITGRGHHLTTFDWEGVRWTPAVVVPRLAWLAGAGLLAMAAALPFDRFAGEAFGRRGGRGKPARAPRDVAAAAPPDAAVVPTPASRPAIAWSALPAAVRRFSPRPLVLAEWRLLTAGSSWLWWIAWLGLQLPGLFAPRDIGARFAAVAWIWPALRWSQLGARDRVHGTRELLDSSPHPIARQLPAAWAAGIALALLAGSGFGLRLIATGDTGGIAGWIAGSLFVPALALALGTLTGGRKTFEIVYVALWYTGPLNGAAFLDFTGASGGGAAAGFAATAVALIILTAVVRRTQLERR